MFPSLQRLITLPTALLLGAAFSIGKAFAFGGTVPGALPGSPDIVTTVTNILSMVLNLLGLLAAVVIVIAGIRLIFSMGDEEGKETAKKTILYAVIGLLIILFAKALITFVLSLG